jgi:hypothetical protein
MAIRWAKTNDGTCAALALDNLSGAQIRGTFSV